MVTLMRSAVLSVLGAQVLGIYLFGSLATGDFDAGVSDIDILVVTGDDLTETIGDDLRAMHNDLAATHPQWRDRIEVIYVAAQGLSQFRWQRSPLSVISPGEAFHTVDAGREWLVNWYNVQQTGRVLYGSALGTLMPQVTVAEVQQELRHQLTGWMARVDGTAQPGFLAYAVLTAARAWDTILHGVVRSKGQSAAVLKEALPQWAGLLNAAAIVRAGRGRVGEISATQVRQFIADLAHRVG